MLGTLNSGDEVLIHEPAWVSYQEQAKLIDVIPKFIPYSVEVNNFIEYITPKTKMIILNNPNNPSGRIYTQKELELLYDLCLQKDIYLLVDEAYSDFIVKENFFSAGRLNIKKNNVIIVNSLSKNMGMSGWRVGYLISNSNVIKAVLKINQHLITCASTVLLYYMAKYFDDIIAHTLPQVRSIVVKRQNVEILLKKHKIKYLPGGATFYFFVNIENYPGDSWDFAMELLKKYDISVVPGSAYGESTNKFVRVSIGTESMERIEHAIKIMHTMLYTHYT
jgi:aspartate aminotransferase/aminotransferase